MVNYLRKILDNRIDQKWYNNTYIDVQNSGLSPTFHYKNYGKKEGRIPNPQYGINSMLFKSIFFILNFCNISIFNFDKTHLKVFNFFQNRLLNFFWNYEYSFLRDIRNKKNKIYLTSWVGGGVSEVLGIYIKQDLRNFDSVMVLRTVKNVSPSNMTIFEIEVHFKFSDKSLKFICPIPKFFLIKLFENQKLFTDIAIHHVFGFEKTLDLILMNLNMTKTFYFHDYYLFSDNWSFFKVFEKINRSQVSYLESEINSLWSLESRLLLLDKIDVLVATSFHSYKILTEENNISKSKLQFHYIPEESNIEMTFVRRPKDFQKIFKIIVLGNLGIYKGLDLLNSLLELIPSENSDIEFFHIGGVAEGVLTTRIMQYGWLEKNDRSNKISEINADLALVPAQSPETYSLILSDLMKFNVPILASHIGAIPERLLNRDFSNSVVNYSNPEAWLTEILAFRNKGSFEKITTSNFSSSDETLIYSKRLRLN